MPDAIDEKLLRRAHNTLVDWIKDFVVVQNTCYRVDRKDRENLGPEVRKYIVAIKQLIENTRSLLATPRDTSKRTMVVNDLQKIDMLQNASEDMRNFDTTFEIGGMMFTIESMFDDIRKAVGVKTKNFTRDDYEDDYEHKYNDGKDYAPNLRMLLTKLEDAFVPNDVV